MKFFAFVFAVMLLAAAESRADAQASLIVAVGAPGEAAYEGDFEGWARLWEKAAAAGGCLVKKIGSGPEAEHSLEQLHAAVSGVEHESTEPLWLVLLGHGTFDGKEPKFNLRGDDLGAEELADWLKPLRRPVIVVCAFSASGAFLKPLSAPGRIVVCATRTGRENNFSRFGGFLAESIADPAADLDKDGATSLLEAWLSAGRRTADFYKDAGRLATEHPLLDDNGDGMGTPPDWFQGVRVVKKSKTSQPPDGQRAHQLFLVPSSAEKSLSPAARAERDALELELGRLREAKASMPEDQYFTKLEAILLRIAKLYQSPAPTGGQ
jgi:hypothetical protein